MPQPPVSRKVPADLLPLVYKELRSLAAGYMRRERAGHVLQPTALVHEAYIALAKFDRIEWRSKTHFLAMAAKQMRLVLVEEARRRHAKKRSGAWERISLEGLADQGGQPVDILDLHTALERLAEQEPRQSQVVEYRIFGGLGEKEIAELLDVSERTVRNDWRLGRARLVKLLTSH